MADHERLNSERVYEGKLLKIDRDRVRLPNGRETTLEMVRHPGASAIVPFITPDILLNLNIRGCVRLNAFSSSIHALNLPRLPSIAIPIHVRLNDQRADLPAAKVGGPVHRHHWFQKQRAASGTEGTV